MDSISNISLSIFTAISLNVLGLCSITQIISLISFSTLLTNIFDFGLIFCQLKTVIILKHKSNYNTPCLAVFQWLFIAFRILSKFSVSCKSVSHSILCLALCDPMDCGLPGSSIHGIFQARILEWVAIPFSRGSSWPRDRTCVSSMQADSLQSEPPGKPSQYPRLRLHSWLSLLLLLCLNELLWFFGPIPFFLDSWPSPLWLPLHKSPSFPSSPRQLPLISIIHSV